jgi:ABC-2 type transport system permease protein
VTVLAVLDSERIKLTSIRSPLWTALLAAVLSVGVAALQGAAAAGAVLLTPEQVSIGVAVFGVPILIILSAMVVTGEYRTGMIRTTFAATPNRTLVLSVKAFVAAALSGVYAAVLVMVAVVAARLTSDPLQTARLSLADPSVWRAAGAVALYAVIAAVLGVAVGALLRHTAGAVALLLLWPLVVEPVVGNLPNFGTRVGPFLPFVNAFVYTEVPWLFPTYVMPWGEYGSLVYFAVITAGLFVAAVLVVNRRDA